MTQTCLGNDWLREFRDREWIQFWWTILIVGHLFGLYNQVCTEIHSFGHKGYLLSVLDYIRTWLNSIFKRISNTCFLHSWISRINSIQSFIITVFRNRPYERYVQLRFFLMLFLVYSQTRSDLSQWILLLNLKNINWFCLRIFWFFIQIFTWIT